MKKTMRITPEGTRDLLFEECSSRRRVERILTSLFERRGYSEVITPGVEFFNVFSAGGAIPPENMYKLVDNKGRLLVLRPDSTTPIARLTAARLRGAALPLRLYYAQDVFYLNHELSGRRDQEFQAGVELIGAAGERADLDVMALAVQALQSCGVSGFKLEIGHVGFFAGLTDGLPPELVAELRTHIEQKNYSALSDLLDGLSSGNPAVSALRRLPRLFGGFEVLEEAARLCRFSPAATSALDTVRRLAGTLSEAGTKGQIMIDLGLLHRNEYYTGVIFRGYIEGSGETVVSGGRYDALLRKFGLPLPATGFGIQVDTLSAAITAGACASAPGILVYAPPSRVADGLRRTAELTAADEAAEFNVSDTLADAVAYARARGIARLLVLKEPDGEQWMDGEVVS